MKYLFASAMLLAAGLAAPASAQASAQGEDDLRINQLIIYGEDACPQSTDNEIVICARRPENDRFRIPENLRDNPNAAANQPWGVRAEELVYLGRTGIGSCSAAGAGGDTGCLLKLTVKRVHQELAGEQERTPGLAFPLVEPACLVHFEKYSRE